MSEAVAQFRECAAPCLAPDWSAEIQKDYKQQLEEVIMP
jgi:hypothetical protein